MPQGWSVNGTTDEITFLEAPAAGTNNIVVKEFPSGGKNVTDVWAIGAWSDEYGYPSEVEFFSDRLVFAGTPSQPQTLWFSKAGNYRDFGRSQPILDDDSIAATINARQVNAVKDLLPLDKLIIMTAGGEWQTGTGEGDVLTPTTIAFKPQTYHGSSGVPALVIGDVGLHVQRGGKVVRTLGYQFERDGYRGNDITVFSSHLFEGRQIVEWDYAQTPLSVVWAVRDDGTLLALTFLLEQEVIGWTPMEIDGSVESVCCIPEGTEDVLYAVIKRTVGGSEKRYIERLSTRTVEDIREATFLDSFLTYDGRNTGATTMTATGASWDVGDQVTLTASASTFASTDLQDVIVLGYGAGLNVRLRITGYTSATVVTAEIDTPVPAAYRGAATTDWGFARDSISGLDHLEGRTVGILCDGRVQDDRVVASGAITLDEPGVLVHVGLPYVADFETLEVNLPGGESPRLNTKLIKRLGLIVKDTRSIRAGPDFGHLDEYESRDVVTDMAAPPALQQDLVEMWVQGDWSQRGRVCVRQADPLPMTILAVIPDYEFGS